MLRTLPIEKHNEKHIQKRKRLLKEVDPNGNNIISLAETQKSVRDAFKLSELFKYKQPMNQAYFMTLADQRNKKTNKLVDDDVPIVRLCDVDLANIGVMESEDKMKRDLE